jgi:cytochrome c-type biogenesis protein CcmH/NrfG
VKTFPECCGITRAIVRPVGLLAVEKRWAFWSPLIVAAAFLSVLLGSSQFAAGQSRAGVASRIAADLRARNFEQALELSRSALRDSPNDPRLLAMEALALSALGKNHEALASYNSALRLSPDYLPALEGAAQIEYNAGSKHAALLLRRILTIRPNDPTSHAMLGVLAYKDRDCKNAVHHFRASGNVLFSQRASKSTLIV